MLHPNAAPAFRLFDDERNARSRFGSAEDFFGVATALTGTEETVSQSFDNRFPRDVSAARGFQQGDVIAFLDRATCLETLLDRLFGGFDLALELMQTGAQT